MKRREKWRFVLLPASPDDQTRAHRQAHLQWRHAAPPRRCLSLSAASNPASVLKAASLWSALLSCKRTGPVCVTVIIPLWWIKEHETKQYAITHAGNLNSYTWAELHKLIQQLFHILEFFPLHCWWREFMKSFFCSCTRTQLHLMAWEWLEAKRELCWRMHWSGIKWRFLLSACVLQYKMKTVTIISYGLSDRRDSLGIPSGVCTEDINACQYNGVCF